MRIGAEAVRHVARLAELAVDEDQVAALTDKLEAIVAFVERLQALDLDAAGEAVVVGPSAVRLRDDVVAPIPMVRGAADLAPEFAEGFFIVPRLGGLADE